MNGSRTASRPARRWLRVTGRALGTSMVVLMLVPVSAAAGAPHPAAAPAATLAVAPDQAATSAVAVVARGDGSNAVFYRGWDDGVYLRTWSAAGWSAQTALGGRIVGAPAAATAGALTVLVGRGTDGALWWRSDSGSGWTGWASLGGIASASPAVVASTGGRIDVFVRGADDRLFTRTRPSATAGWTSWATLGGLLATGPGAVAFGPGSIDVFAAGSDHAVWRRSRTTSGWSGWQSLGGRTYTAPAAARIADSGLARVLVRGTNDDLWFDENGAAGWSGWHTTSPAGILIDAPAATGTPTGADVVVRGANDSLYTRTLRGGVWSGYTSGWTAAPPPAPAGALLGRDWEDIPTTAKVVALTFDAGGNSDGFASIRTTLERKNVPATFFLTGAWVREFPAQANEVAVAGFAVGNHSDTHPDFTTLTDAQVLVQLTNARTAILRGNGAEPHPLFRFPFGAVDGGLITVVNSAGYVPVRWTVDSLGWAGTSRGTVQTLVTRVLNAARPGEIVLMHVGSNPDDHTTFDAAALPQIIDGLRARGYRFVTLRTLTG